MSRKRHQRGGKIKSVYTRSVASLHSQIEHKSIQHWLREQRGRYHCLVFGSPAKPKLQDKENFLVSHLSLRGEG